MKTCAAVVILFAAAVLADEVKNTALDDTAPDTAPEEATLNDEPKQLGIDNPSNTEGGKGSKGGRKSKGRSEDKPRAGDATGTDQPQHPHHHHHHHPHNPYDMNAMPQNPCPYFLTPTMLYHMLLQQYPQEAQYLAQSGMPNYPHPPYPSVVQSINPATGRAEDRPLQGSSAMGNADNGKVKTDDAYKVPGVQEVAPLPL